MTSYYIIAIITTISTFVSLGFSLEAVLTSKQDHQLTVHPCSQHCCDIAQYSPLFLS
ncbi:hypothetical protein [Macrococcus lamae]|uniref:hypothetical protein n=1 Tax=Macrococcus lamae TaxID=198484 RepID=UPI00140E1643|nr:hypothetical protein [Macrococcus lamae]